MGRKKKIHYERTPFAIRITELQEENHYSDNYVCDNLRNSNGGQLITEPQTLISYKIGKRLPRDFYEVVCAFANFYHVTTDYLLGMDDTKHHNTKKVTTITGLSTDAIESLISLKRINSDYEGLFEMIDSFISGISRMDKFYLMDLFEQLFNDYKSTLTGNTSANYDLNNLQQQFITTQQMYNYIKAVTTPKLAPIFEKRIKQDEDRNNYYHSEEYINSIPDVSLEDYELAYDNGDIKVLHAERYK